MVEKSNDRKRRFLLNRYESHLTRLNQRLANAEDALARLPMIVETEVEVDAETTVDFLRRGDRWGLVLSIFEEDEWETKHWENCSIDEKATIAAKLPELLDNLRKNASRRQAAVMRAHKALDEFESKLNGEKGGE